MVLSFIAELTADVILLHGAASKGDQLKELLKHPSNQHKFCVHLTEKLTNTNATGMYSGMVDAAPVVNDVDSDDDNTAPHGDGKTSSLKQKPKKMKVKKGQWYNQLYLMLILTLTPLTSGEKLQDDNAILAKKTTQKRRKGKFTPFY